MKAYAIFDGGGVKGAAFAGCLKAAEELEIDFLGYGGTSAGSIVALLAYVGYNGHEIENIMVKEIDFTKFLDDDGINLNKLKKIIPPNKFGIFSGLWWMFKLYWYRNLIGQIVNNYGLYKAIRLKKFLAEKIWVKIPALKDDYDFNFIELREERRKLLGTSVPLKVVGSDLNKRTPIVYSDGSNHRDSNISVLSAVRASISYPFVFIPVPDGDNFIVDGGLTINLPIHIFQHERENRRTPIIAFDLVDKKLLSEDDYNVAKFVKDMLETALSSSEHLVHLTTQGVYQIPIRIPDDISTLDFSISSINKQRLSDIGHSATRSYFTDKFPKFENAKTVVEKLQAQYVAPKLVEPVLQAIALDFEKHTKAEDIRCSIMLPINAERKIVTYQYNMDFDADVNLDLKIDGGCSGGAWTKRNFTFSNLEDAEENYDKKYNMTREEQNKIPSDRKAMLSAPILDYSVGNDETPPKDLPILGIISIDTTTKLEETEWVDDELVNGELVGNEWVIKKGLEWFEIVSRILV